MSPDRVDPTTVVEAPAQVPAAPMFAALEGYCANVQPSSSEEFAARAAAIQSELKQRELAGVLIEPGVSLQYAFGVRWGASERPFVAFLPQEGRAQWLCPAFERRTAEEQLGQDASIVTWHEHEDPFAVLAEAVGLRGKFEIAVDASARGFLVDGFQRAFGEGHVIVADPVGACRIIKQPSELGRLRRANEATKAALQLAAQHLRPGMREREFAELVTQAQHSAGLEHVWALVLFGPNASYPHGTRHEHALAKGDLVLVDTGGSLHGYASDITRTWAVGTPHAELQRAWDAVRRAQDAALEQLLPGKRCADAEAAARSVIVEAGWGPAYAFFTHRLGHGIGLQVHEHPYLVQGNATVLQPGMVMSNEPGVYVAGRFGVRIEDIVAITTAEPEVFGPRVRSLAQPFG